MCDIASNEQRVVERRTLSTLSRLWPVLYSLRICPSSFALVLAALLITSVSVQSQPLVEVEVQSDWGDLPETREWGAVSGVHPDPDGEHMWVLDRCGANSCLGSDLDPVLKFDLEGNFVDSFGGGKLAWPHGFFVDHEGYVWVTDAGTGERAAAAAEQGLGHQVIKFDPTNGDVVLALGTPGVSGRGQDTFNGPSEVMVSPDGEIFVADGHDADGNNRVVKFAEDGRYLLEWGVTGPGPAAGEMRDPHAIAMDSSGRVFVGDRGNTRVQIFSSDGVFLEQWSHLGPTSQIYITGDDLMYVTDAPSIAAGTVGQYRTEDWVRGVRIADALTGEVTGFVPSEAEFAAADRTGAIYGAEVQGRNVVKYVRE